MAGHGEAKRLLTSVYTYKKRRTGTYVPYYERKKPLL